MRETKGTKEVKFLGTNGDGIKFLEYVTGEIRYQINTTVGGKKIFETKRTLEEAEDRLEELRKQNKALLDNKDFKPSVYDEEYPFNLIRELGWKFSDTDYVVANWKGNFEDKLHMFLGEREIAFLIDYYKGGYTLAEIGIKYNLTRERIRQINYRTIHKLFCNEALYVTVGCGKDIVKERLEIDKLRAAIDELKKQLINKKEYMEKCLDVSVGVSKKLAEDILQNSLGNKTLETSIYDLGFSYRTTHCLARNNVLTVGEILKMGLSGLMDLRTMGNVTLKEIMDKMKTLGIEMTLEQGKNKAIIKRYYEKKKKPNEYDMILGEIPEEEKYKYNNNEIEELLGIVYTDSAKK